MTHIDRFRGNLYYNEKLVSALVDQANELIDELEAEYREYDRVRWSEEFDQMSEDDQLELERIGHLINRQIYTIKTAGQGRR